MVWNCVDFIVHVNYFRLLYVIDYPSRPRLLSGRRTRLLKPNLQLSLAESTPSLWSKDLICKVANRWEPMVDSRVLKSRDQFRSVTQNFPESRIELLTENIWFMLPCLRPVPKGKTRDVGSIERWAILAK